MKATEKLELYLAEFRQRLKKLVILQGVAAVAAVILIISLIAAWLSLENGYADSTVITFRLLLILALAVVTLKGIVEPLKRIKDNVSSQIESRSAKTGGKGFQGRVETYAQMEQGNPFRELLAEDALKISESYPAAEQVKNKDMQIAGLAAAAMLAVLIYMSVGAGLFSYSLQNFLAGWASDSFVPPQSIVVLPGDESVRRGSNLRINAQVEGFDPDEATLHVRSDGEDWQEVPLIRTMDGFEFTLFSLQEEMDYYVSTTGLRSPDFTVQVVDLPSIENLELTYIFPEWTARESETSTRGDIEALAETKIILNVTTSGPLPAGELILNNTSQALSINGNEASTEFMILEEGQYYIAALVGGEQVRLSDDYFISIAEDGSPQIELMRPGQDWNATNIEEVLARVDASDDYALESLLIKYSINGGDWQEVDLYEAADELSIEHIFMLEDMRTVQTRTAAAPKIELGAFDIVLGDALLPVGVEEGEEGEEEIASLDPSAQDNEPTFDEIPLKPGDLISYYAEASDRSRTVQTDIYFIQIQAYNRRYSQSQLSGGGGGGGGSPTDEISQRQRQIVVSTWNLIREAGEGNNGQVEINSSLLSELQLTLAQQAQTLTDRARARQLNQQDEDVERFVESMDLAIQAMFPSSEHLASLELQEAIQPAQEALQHLLQAEAVFNDMQVGQQQGGSGGGGGSRASQDLAEMFELEMDMEQNQYETGESASPQAQQEQLEDIMAQLDELAQRQEQLANNMRNQQQLTEAQQYQQEMLRRDAEQLQEQLEQLQQQQLGQQGQQQANNQQQGQPGQQGQQTGQEGQQGQEQEGQQTAQNELQRRLESAIRAMNETEEAMANNLGSEELQRAAEEAQRQLEGARDQLAQDQIASMRESFASMADQSADMLLAQERMQQQLQEAMELALSERESGDNPNSRGMTLLEEMELADKKEELAADLQRLQQQMMNTMQQFGDETPAAARQLAEGNETIAERELELALSDAALYIDAGYALYIAGNERNVTEGMRALNESLERAEQLALGALDGDSDLEQALEQAGELRDQLAQLSQQNGQQPGQGGQQQGQEGEGQQGQGQQQGGLGGRPDGIVNGQGPTAWSGNGANTAFDGPIEMPGDFYDGLDNLTELTRDAIPEMQMTQEQINELLDVIRELEFSRVNRNDDIVLEEYNNMLALIEQLELSLRFEGRNTNNSNNVRTAVLDMIPEEYQESVAEYYRRLSRENN
ncbi:MAG: hypothetical protein COA71_00915 [SAR86 cluster bacterium]|uniref:DUF4175 domain-containing protein n=1 Tax=SAR86 cluster bacterium TaxID=2030880 RepID=A0A2A5CIY4_9GAMM|nr:hypothetical protein [Gammaproteobacteria bacterium AH-315-E17]PCJ43465.1 MAG: hypothetical protein COA71_00915 [SAR86 cluster bacterium]